VGGHDTARRIFDIDLHPLSSELARQGKFMLAIHRLLVPVDFSPASVRALNHADALAQRFGASLHVCYVHVPLELSMLDGLIQETPEHLANALTRAQEELDNACRDLSTPQARRTCEVVLGHPVEAIVERSAKVDLVVMATSGRTGLAHMLIGSVAERVVRLAKCSVWIVKDAV
jgi:nucleotide-binding universal stress UspA family protein